MIHIQEFLDAEKAIKQLLEIAKIRTQYYKLLEDFDVGSRMARHAAVTLNFNIAYRSEEFPEDEKEQVQALENKYNQLIGLSRNEVHK